MAESMELFKDIFVLLWLNYDKIYLEIIITTNDDGKPGFVETKHHADQNEYIPLLK